MSFKKYAGAASILPFMLAFGQAVAQTDAEPARQRDDDVIIVTGEKFDRSLQDTPASVRVIAAEDIDNNNIDDLRDLYRRTPNVYGGESTGDFAIRGINAFDVSGGGSSFLASVYVDGAVMPRRGVLNGPTDIWDISQVEILRGPQSTLQGRNALAGAIIVRSTDPTWEWDAKARVKIADYDYQEYAAAGGGPLVEDELAFRVAVSHTEFGGYVENTFLDQDSAFSDRTSARVKLLWEPDALPDFRALLTFSHNDHYYGPNLSLISAGSDDRELNFDTPTWESIITNITTLELEYRVNESWTLESITSHNTADYEYQYDGDYTVEPLGSVYDVEDATTFTQELRGLFDYGALTGLVGAYYFDSDEDVYYGGRRSLTLQALGVPQLLTAPPEFGGLGLPQALADQVLGIYEPANPVLLDTLTENPDKVMSYALFTDVRYDVNDKLTIYGGARYDREEQENFFSSLITVANIDALPDPVFYGAIDPQLGQLIAGLNAQLLGQAAGASGEAPVADTTFEAFLPKVGATWNWTEDLSTSFTVQQGYRSGGVGANIARASSFTFDPEYTTNYEFALRSQWLGGALTANANVFYIDWTDQQISIQLSGNQFDSETVNAGSSHLQGAEFEVFYRPTSNLDLFGGVGYVKTEFDEFFDERNGVVTDLSGREFAGAPNWTVSGGGTWRGANGLFIHADANYVSESNAVVNPAVFNVDPKIDARTLVNAMVGWEGETFSAYLYTNNLFDEDYVYRPDYDDGLATYGAPRVIGVRFDVSY
ncbi:TonB-dependent receptor [Parvularcula marina]|uniref:TonB-dependent receptor n=1 Tax=Parvularcula marina TaxID=2292771 RepID=A0A371R7I7_9PROT|nr:TonB-dependent receptor [Parvularcula marina]RFB01403.1 hypothetical protein DX908_14010 [Parvularcula marina]